MELLDSREIGENVKAIRPHSVAVAYLGREWHSYLDTDSLESIVTSTDIGTNPNAVDELVRIVGWDRVHLLDQLHAKVYLGENAVIVGSANLSENGLGPGGLYEAAAFSETLATRKSAQETITDIVAKAKEQYQTDEEKERKLEEMHRRWNRAQAQEITPQSMSKGEDIPVTAVDSARFWVTWYMDGDTGIDTSTVYANTDISESELQSDNYAYLDFLKNDAIAAGDWLLTWRCKSDGRPDRRTDPEWMFVHATVDGAVTDDGKYTKAALELDRKRPQPPFKLTRETKDAILEILSTDDHQGLRPDGSGGWEGWSLDETRPFLKRFLRDVQRSLEY